ncbi:hypothetical protein B566_EDAN009375 [Ephemera danica]|nr:hypothetical protein B566_EDAN009375 [Ephemera danica]
MWLEPLTADISSKPEGPCPSMSLRKSHSTRLLAATTLRNVLGTRNLSEILSDREAIAHMMQSSLDEATDPWGVKVERVEIDREAIAHMMQSSLDEATDPWGVKVERVEI